eukprot:2898958-Pleurochrysis_carterae.AAC.1
MNLCTPLHAQTRLEGTAALALVNPDESDDRPAGWNLRAIDRCPTAIGGVVSNLGALSSTLINAVFSHGLLTRARISGDIAHGEGAARAASPGRLVFARSKSE